MIGPNNTQEGVRRVHALCFCLLCEGLCALRCYIGDQDAVGFWDQAREYRLRNGLR